MWEEREASVRKLKSEDLRCLWKRESLALAS